VEGGGGRSGKGWLVISWRVRGLRHVCLITFQSTRQSATPIIGVSPPGKLLFYSRTTRAPDARDLSLSPSPPLSLSLIAPSILSRSVLSRILFSTIAAAAAIPPSPPPHPPRVRGRIHRRLIGGFASSGPGRSPSPRSYPSGNPVCEPASAVKTEAEINGVNSTETEAGILLVNKLSSSSHRFLCVEPR